MTEVLTESFCERCGTKYTFEGGAEAPSPVRRARTLARGLRYYLLSDDPLDEALAEARRDDERDSAGRQLDAFHQTFNFCIECRQYVCGECWNEQASRCLTCAPMPGRVDVLGLEVDLGVRLGPAATVTEAGGALGEAEAAQGGAWPAADLVAAPGEATPAQPTRVEATPDEATAGQTAAAEAMPVEATSAEATPVDATSAEVLPAGPAPAEAAASAATETGATLEAAPVDGSAAAAHPAPQAAPAEKPAEKPAAAAPSPAPQTAPAGKPAERAAAAAPQAAPAEKPAERAAAAAPSPAPPTTPAEKPAAPAPPQPAAPAPPPTAAPAPPAPVWQIVAPEEAPPAGGMAPGTPPASGQQPMAASPGPRPPRGGGIFRRRAPAAPSRASETAPWMPPTVQSTSRTGQPAAPSPAWVQAQSAGGQSAAANGLWENSARGVLYHPGSSVQACVSCGLPLSATARFCRRCGSKQD